MLQEIYFYYKCYYILVDSFYAFYSYCESMNFSFIVIVRFPKYPLSFRIIHLKEDLLIYVYIIPYKSLILIPIWNQCFQYIFHFEYLFRTSPPINFINLLCSYEFFYLFHYLWFHISNSTFSSLFSSIIIFVLFCKLLSIFNTNFGVVVKSFSFLENSLLISCELSGKIF